MHEKCMRALRGSFGVLVLPQRLDVTVDLADAVLEELVS